MLRHLPGATCYTIFRRIHGSSTLWLPVPAGEKLQGFDFLKESEPLVAKPREEYPEWVDTLAKPMKTLAELRKMEFEDASDKERMRYLVLTRRQVIKDSNIES